MAVPPKPRRKRRRKPEPTPVPRPADPYRVTIRTADGVALAASWRPVEGDAQAPGVLLIHDFSRERREWEPFAEELRALGLATLSFDLRAHGESTKKAGSTLRISPTLLTDPAAFPRDVEAAAAWLRTKSPRTGGARPLGRRLSRAPRLVGEAGGRRRGDFRERAARSAARRRKEGHAARGAASRLRGRSRPRRVGAAALRASVEEPKTHASLPRRRPQPRRSPRAPRGETGCSRLARRAPRRAAARRRPRLPRSKLRAHEHGRLRHRDGLAALARDRPTAAREAHALRGGPRGFSEKEEGRVALAVRRQGRRDRHAESRERKRRRLARGVRRAHELRPRPTASSSTSAATRRRCSPSSGRRSRGSTAA